jgi:cell division protein FtsB
MMLARALPWRRSAEPPPPSIRRSIGPPPFPLRLATVLLVPIVFYALYATGEKALQNYAQSQQLQALVDETRALRDENLRLQAEIRRARTDTAIEAVAREQLGLVKPGDRAVVLLGLGPAITEGAPPPPTAPAPVRVPPWRQWLDYFFGPSPATG